MNAEEIVIAVSVTIISTIMAAGAVRGITYLVMVFA